MLTVSIALTLNSIAGSAGPILVSKTIDIVVADPRVLMMLLTGLRIMTLVIPGLMEAVLMI